MNLLKSLKQLFGLKTKKCCRRNIFNNGLIKNNKMNFSLNKNMPLGKLNKNLKVNNNMTLKKN